MRPLAILGCFALLAACSPTGTISADQPDAAPIKLPPQGKPGGDTAPGCDGVPESGRCDQGVALYCDVAHESLRQVDCRALGTTCVQDPARGAACVDLGLAAPGAEGVCGGQVDEQGFCSGTGAAVWCDASSDQIVAWGCQESGLSCAVNQCQSGAYCCRDEEAPNECESLGFYGECQGDTARYCTGSDTLIELDCAAAGKVCALDTCALGAFCCAPPDEPEDECDRLGLYGACGGPDGDTVRYCIGDTLYELECASPATSCMLDVCFPGADCCTPAEYELACQVWGDHGICGGPAGDTVVWCNEAGEILRLDCDLFELSCGVDDCGPGALCC